MTWQLGKAEISVLWPQAPIDTENTNNTSIVLRLVYGSISFLFTGDLEADAESKLAQSEATLSSTVLKVGHHGSATSSSYTFLRRVLPQFAVISCGAGNSYGHPEEATLSRLAPISAGLFLFKPTGKRLPSALAIPSLPHRPLPLLHRHWKMTVHILETSSQKNFICPAVPLCRQKTTAFILQRARRHLPRGTRRALIANRKKWELVNIKN